MKDEEDSPRIHLLPVAFKDYREYHDDTDEAETESDGELDLEAFDSDKGNHGWLSRERIRHVNRFFGQQSHSPVSNSTTISRRSYRNTIIIVFATFFLLCLLAKQLLSPPAQLNSFQRAFTSHDEAFVECSPAAWSAGTWEKKDTLPTRGADVREISGYEGCASDSEVEWHFSVPWGNFTGYADYRRKASDYVYVPGPGCRKHEFDKEKFVKELVERGGWMVYGDSISEESFFALSCMLYPHVIASRSSSEWKDSPDWRAEPQDLLLNPKSPLVKSKSITFPTGFHLSTTPLVSFQRMDLLFDQKELMAIHDTISPPFNRTHPSISKDLFGDEQLWVVPASKYLSLFTAPSPMNYRVLFINTAGHWTTTTFGLKGGLNEIINLFKFAVDRWLIVVNEALKKDEKREVVVRAYLGGHDECHYSQGPVLKPIPYTHEIYNWNSIWKFNDIFEKAIVKLQHPRITFLDIVRPALLRPDAHVDSDCLHYAIGTGVVEGWNDYVAHWTGYHLDLDRTE